MDSYACRRIQQAGKTYIAKEGSRIRNSKSMGQNRRAYKQDVGKETGNEYLNKQEQEEVIGHVGFLCSSFGPNNNEQLFANNTAEKMMIYLPDSSSVTLYPNANVRYRTGGMNSAREVALNGKAFFNVRKMHGGAFKVQSENLMVEVLGTSFLVDATKAESSSVYVKTGVVSVESENSKVIIKANQKAELDNKTLKTGKIENPYEVFEEKPKVLSFENAGIMEVVEKIEQTTGVKIEVSKELRNNKITSRIYTADTEAIIVELAFLCSCKYETLEAGKHYRLY